MELASLLCINKYKSTGLKYSDHLAEIVTKFRLNVFYQEIIEHPANGI